MNQKRKMRYTSQKGITLIALVITIIVLLILAGVTISMVLGDDGIIAQAQQAKKENEEASLKEAISVAKAEAALTPYVEQKPMSDSALNEALGKTGTERIENNETVAKVVERVPIPLGFAYVEGTKVDTGLIVVDEYGNEYVWVPVKDFSKFATSTTVDGKVNYQSILYEFDSDGNMQPKTGSTYTEPGYATGYDEDKGLNPDDKVLYTEYNQMAESVKKYKGFYVGRYETGGFNTTRVVSKAGEDQASCTGVDWYDMYIEQKKLHENSVSVTSGMIYGAQWDAIMLWMKDIDNKKETGKYIANSKGMGNYGGVCPNCHGDLIDENGFACDVCYGMANVGTFKKTGSNTDYAVNNIFDLAGNGFEFTQECSGSSRVFRGGCFNMDGSQGTASYSAVTSPKWKSGEYSSRLQVYIK